LLGHRSKLAELEAHIKQLHEYIERFRQGRDSLARRLEMLEWQLKGLIKVHFPSRYKHDLKVKTVLPYYLKSFNIQLKS